MGKREAWTARILRIGKRTLKASIVFILTLSLVVESISSVPGESMPIQHPSGWFQIATALFAIGVYVRYRPGRKRWIAYASIASLAATMLGLLTNHGRGIFGAEMMALLLLMLLAVRHWDAPPGRWVSFTLGAAVLASGMRYYVHLEAVIGGTVMMSLALSTAAGFGAYLYGMDKLRRETQEEVRRSERMELAREMHDFVAHHVTGMVVLAQAAQVTDTAPQAKPSTQPQGGALTENSLKAFGDIEEAGLAALASMRRMVRMLRAEDGAGVNPLGDLSQIEDLVERFSREGTDASCFISPELASGLAPEVAATAHRVVREALTNVRKHAQSTKRVRVVVAAAGSKGLEVSIRDDGRGSRGRLADSGGGLGLMGLNERVETVGGSLRAEPRAEGGWEVVAWLPRAAATAPASSAQ